jgi:hypothetical protein
MLQTLLVAAIVIVATVYAFWSLVPGTVRLLAVKLRERTKTG